MNSERIRALFLVVSQGFEARYLLRTTILPELKTRTDKLVILAPNAEEDRFREEFESDNVVVAKLDIAGYQAFYRNSPTHRVLRRLRYHFLGGKDTDLTPLDDKGGSGRAREKPQRAVQRPIFDLVLMMSKRYKLMRRMLLWLENKLRVPPLHGHLFERYKPELLVIPGVGYHFGDTYIAREARQNGVRVASVVYGWDKAYSQGYRGVNPDAVVCWSPVMKQELVQFQEIASHRVYVAGNAYFDVYKQRGGRQSKERFCLENGLDPNRKTILFATKSPGSYPNHIICRLLAEIINGDKLSQPCQLLVRLHPIHLRPDFTDTDYGRYLMGKYKEITDRFDHVSVYLPTGGSQSLRMDMDTRETMVIADQLTHSNMVVTLFSTIMLEAFCVGVPVVNVGFDVEDPLDQKVFRPISIDMDQIHLRRLVSSDSTWIARNEDELVDTMNQALENPEGRRPQMDAVLASECGNVDGQAGARVASFIEGMVQQNGRAVAATHLRRD